jgi:hypothetical protein
VVGWEAPRQRESFGNLSVVSGQCFCADAAVVVLIMHRELFRAQSIEVATACAQL